MNGVDGSEDVIRVGLIQDGSESLGASLRVKESFIVGAISVEGTPEPRFILSRAPREH